MNPELQRIAIAEACGWHDWRGIESPHDRVKAFGDVLPDYLNDLNAMREAEKVLPDYSPMIRYYNLLCSMCQSDDYGIYAHREIYATAKQRAEAFLKTIGKWKEQPKAADE